MIKIIAIKTETGYFINSLGGGGYGSDPSLKNRLVSVREAKIFEMTHAESNYKGYTPIQGFEADNEAMLKEQIDNYLADLMDKINEPLVECPYCKGRGVILNG